MGVGLRGQGGRGWGDPSSTPAVSTGRVVATGGRAGTSAPRLMHSQTDIHVHTLPLCLTHTLSHTTLRLTPGLLFLDLEWLPGRWSTSCGTWEHGRNTQESTF